MLKWPRRGPTRSTVPPGAEFAYAVASKRLDEQLGSVADLDRKLGVVIAVAGALLVALAQFSASRTGAIAPLWARAAAGLPAILALLLGLAGFFVRKFEQAPDPGRMAEYVSESPESMRWTALPAVLRALNDNRLKLRWKRRALNAAVIAVGLAALAESAAVLLRLA